MSKSRADIIKSISYYSGLRKEDSNEAEKGLRNIILELIHSYFFPILDMALKAHDEICEMLSNEAEQCFDLFLRLSPYCRCPEPEDVFKRLLEHFHTTKGNLDTKFVDPAFLSIFPIKIKLEYFQQEVISGEKAKIKIEISSFIKFPITIDNFSIIFNHIDNSDERKSGIDIVSIKDNIKLEPNFDVKLTQERTLPPAISSEKIEFAILRFDKFSLKIPIKTAPILISPDPNALKIEAILPDKCISDIYLPFNIKLTASDQKIQKLSFIFIDENKDIPILIEGKCNGKEFRQGQKVALSDIDPFNHIDLLMRIKSNSPILKKVYLQLSFGTQLSGTGIFTKTYVFDFQSPLITKFTVYDENFVAIQNLSQSLLGMGYNYTIMTNLRNNIHLPLTIKSIQGTLNQLVNQEDLPIKLKPNEEYNLIGKIDSKGSYDSIFNFNIDGIPDDITSIIKLPYIDSQSNTITYKINSPMYVTKFKEFSVEVEIQKSPSTTTDITKVIFEIGKSPAFLVREYVKKNIFIFPGQKKILKIKIFPIESGSTVLPEITLSEIKPSVEPKKFLIPIIITN